MPKTKNPGQKTILVPIRITPKQNEFLQEFIRKGMFSSRQEAIKYFISERMLRSSKKPAPAQHEARQ